MAELLHEDDVDEATDLFTKRLTEILDKVAPIKTIQVRSNYLPWMSDITKANINLRNDLLSKAKKTKDDKHWKEYKKLRNFINNSIKAEKRQWQEHKLKSFGKDSKSIWKNVKKLVRLQISWLPHTANG